MPIMNCAQHGWQGAELVTAGVKERFADGRLSASEVVPLELTWDEICFPLAALRSELPLPGTELKDGALYTDDEEVFNAVLGKLRPVCARCFHKLIDQVSAAPIFEIEPPATRVQLNTPLVVALGHAYECFARTGQDLKNFEIQISERTRENCEDENGENTMGVAFVAKMEPGKKGLGNANRLGCSVLYIASKTTGEILREAGSR